MCFVQLNYEESVLLNMWQMEVIIFHERCAMETDFALLSDTSITDVL